MPNLSPASPERYVEFDRRRGQAESAMVPGALPIFPAHLYEDPTFHQFVPHIPIVESSQSSGQRIIPFDRVLDGEGRCLYPLLFYGIEDEYVVEIDCQRGDLPVSIGERFPKPSGYLGFILRPRADNLFRALSAYNADKLQVNLSPDELTDVSGFIRVSLEKALHRNKII